jgi:hypothetical protein
MKLKKFPVLDTSEFKLVIVDATRRQDGTYSAMFHYVKRFATEKKPNARGFVLNTHVEAESLHQLYHKVCVLYEMGLFNGTELSEHGELRDHTGEVIYQICWHDFSNEEDEDITDEIAQNAGRTLH